MRKGCGFLTAVGLGLASGGALAQDEIEIDWLSLAQFTAERLDNQGGVSFGSDRLRFRSEARYKRITGAVQLDVGPDDLGDHRPGAFANIIADIFVNYDIGNGHGLRFGQFKTPLGMDFNTSGSSLDITKRGMEAGLALNRDIGLMVSGRDVGGGFGYDLGFFNIAGRSSATTYSEAQEGEDNAYAARVHYDTGNWHAELAYGETGNAGGPGTADYSVSDFGIRYRGDRWTVKGEWIDGSNVRGASNRDEDVYFLHGGFDLSGEVELVARHYEGESSIGGSTTDLRNTYLGVSWRVYETPRMNGRLQVNYVLAGGDELAYTGVRGYRDDAVLVQFQFYADK
jgi:hypothetical protein